MSRLTRFNSYGGHPWLRKTYLRLSAADIRLAEAFIRGHELLPRKEFEMAVNRMFLDKPKPKNATLILELLSCCNTEVGSDLDRTAGV